MAINQQSNVPAHCYVCGDTHSGKCSPDSFIYYHCSNCDKPNELPFDAAMFGLNGIYCCDKPASETWKVITHERYLELKNQQ